MPRRTKSISLLLVATALSLTGNIYAEIATGWKSHRYSC